MTTRKAEEISGNGKDENENTPVAKKLKSSPTDLVLLIGEEKYEYHCHAVFMAAQSDFIDAALASPMRESQTNVIELLDITPKIWGLMMKIIDSPIALNKLETTMGDILLAAEKFDKYQFANGVACCAAKVSSGFQGLAGALNSDRLRVDQKIKSAIKHALRCAEIGLDDAMPSVYAFFKLALAMPLTGKNYFGGLIFKEDQVKQLAPLIVKGRLLGNKWTEEEILSPLFPKHYLNTATDTYEERRFGPKHQRPHLKVVGVWLKKSKNQKFKVAHLTKESRISATPFFSGQRVQEGLSWGETLNISRLYLEKAGANNWFIGAQIGDQQEGIKLWKCPMSNHFKSYPPRKGWIKAHDSLPDGAIRVELEEAGEGGTSTARQRRSLIEVVLAAGEQRGNV